LVAAIVGELHATHVLVWLGVHGGGLKYFQEHANNYKRPKYHSSDEHQSIFFKCKLVAWAGQSTKASDLKYF
jgi:hypothetical protein